MGRDGLDSQKWLSHLVEMLFDGGQVVDVLLEGLVVLALDLQLGLELLHQELETGNFGFEFDDVGVCPGSAETLGGWRSGPWGEGFG